MTTPYEELQEAWKREFHISELQSLRQGFLKELASYVRRLREAQRNLDAKSLKATVIDDEMKRIELLLTQLMDRRLEKLTSRSNQIQSTNLDPVERQAYEDLSDTLLQYGELKEDLLQGREPSSSRVRERTPVLVRFVKDVPSIIGVDLKTHGPFLREDVAKLPAENAQSLIRQGAAVQIGTSVQDNG